MSRPKNYWFFTAKSMVMRYNQIKSGKSRQEKIWTKAISETLEDTRNRENGEYKAKAITAVLLDKRLTTLGASEELHYSERTIRRWTEEFVNEVGKRAGY